MRIGATDGRLLMMIGGVVALFAAATRDGPGAVAGVLAAGAGALELHGVNRLSLADRRGMHWLVGSQLALLVVALGYVAARLTLLDGAQADTLLTPRLVERLQAAGVTPDEMLPMGQLLHRMVYTLVALGTVAYQGGMIWFLVRKRAAVEQAIAAEALVEPE